MQTRCGTCESRSRGVSDSWRLLHRLRSRESVWSCWLPGASETLCLSRRWHTPACGLGKARALRWSDVRAGSLLVERAVARRAIKATKKERLRAIRLVGALADDLAMWRDLASFSGDNDLVFPNRTGGVTSDYDWRNWRKRVFAPAATSGGITIGRPYDLRHSFASLLIHEGRSLAEVAVQLGDAVATVASTYTHAFVEAEALPREPAANVIEAARVMLGVRQLYVGLEAVANGEAGNPASEERADARTRTGDPFITRERRVRDTRARAGTAGHISAGDQPVSPLRQWTQAPARARADVPVLYPGRGETPRSTR
jgi:hypothetical protein